MVRIVRATEADWRTLRQVRLAALRDAPHAFGSTYEKERQWAQDDWRDWAAKSGQAEEAVIFFAFEGSRAVGIVGGFKGVEGSVDLVSMWVGPTARRKGVGRALADAIGAWGRKNVARRVSLWVADDNIAARELYLALGYQPTTDKRPLPSDPSRQITRFDLLLRGTPAR